MNQTEERIIKLIDSHAEQLLNFAREVAINGEPGFYEFETARRITEFLKELNLSVKTGIAITGVKSTVGKKPGPTVGIISELDGILCPKHPQANPENGISHACGHNAQMAVMLGAAIALSDEKVLEQMHGSVAFLGIPAEEHLDAKIADSLIQQGKIKYSSGKTEWIHLGEMDDIDIAMTTHVHMVPSDSDLLIGNNSANGTIGKTITVLGKAAHAAAAPHEGVNALNAASLGMSALGMLRETFQEKDYVRVHPVIKKGGDAVNVVPDEVILEAMVRAKTMEVMLDVSDKTDRVFAGCASALGAKTQVKNYLGKLPVIETPPCGALCGAAELLEGQAICSNIVSGVQNTASTDVGDLTHLMPVVNFSYGNFKGALHSAEFKITDEYKAYILPAKLMALTVYRLLRGGAEEAKTVIKEFTPKLTKQQYFDYIHKLID